MVQARSRHNLSSYLIGLRWYPGSLIRKLDGRQFGANALPVPPVHSSSSAGLRKRSQDNVRVLITDVIISCAFPTQVLAAPDHSALAQ
jgi:hypothetical protein